MVFARTNARDVHFGAFAILQIAEEVERKAAAFYVALASEVLDEEQRGLYLKLASWRRRHADAVSRMQHERADLTDGCGSLDCDDYVLSHPRVMAGLTWSGTRPLPRGRSIRRLNRTQILREAITRSKGIVIFYHGLKGFAESSDSLAVIDRLIAREDRHIRLLHFILARVQGCSGNASTLRQHSSFEGEPSPVICG